MKIYVFGNRDVPEDARGLRVAEELEDKIMGVYFVFVRPNEDVPFADERRVVILDTVRGLSEVALIEGEEIDGLVLPPRGTAHDFDLAFQLKYLKKLGRLGEVAVIGIPWEGRVDYLRVQSILRKLVAQDMQGS